jgi:hypothetical protein
MTQSFAAGSVYAHITSVRVDSTGKGIIYFEQPIGGSPPTCVQAGFTNAFSFDTNTAGGRAILAVALASKAQGIQIFAQGNGTCTTYASQVEDLSFEN